MHEVLEKNYIVDSRDSDMFGYLRTSSLLGFMQDVATDHAINLGVSRDILMDRYGAFWMMVRMWFSLRRPIRAFESITIRTWHRGDKGASVHRDFDILADGQLIGEAVTNWIIAGLDDRRILKPASVREFVTSARPEKIKKIKPGKIVLPENMALYGTRTVHYSDADINGHMNNTRYADIACDASGLCGRESAFVSEMQIGYLSECFPGDDILVLRGVEKGYIFISGTDSKGNGKFDVRLKLSDVSDDRDIDTVIA